MPKGTSISVVRRARSLGSTATTMGRGPDIPVKAGHCRMCGAGQYRKSQVPLCGYCVIRYCGIRQTVTAAQAIEAMRVVMGNTSNKTLRQVIPINEREMRGVRKAWARAARTPSASKGDIRGTKSS